MVAKLNPGNLTTIDDLATAWGVSPKTVQNWAEFVYQAFEIIVPANGPYFDWGVALLTITAKHVGAKAAMYTAETGEKRRLKGTEFVEKIRRLRAEGHFEEFRQFQNFQHSAPLPSAEDIEDGLLAEVGQLTREGDQRMAKLRAAIAKREDEQVEQLVTFVEDSDHRLLGKLSARLQASRALKAVEDPGASIDGAIETAYTTLE